MTYKLQPRYTWLWIVWLAAFVVIEAVALWSPKRGDTLSEHVWRWFHIKPGLGKRPRKWLRFILLAFMAWLSVHFLTGGVF